MKGQLKTKSQTTKIQQNKNYKQMNQAMTKTLTHKQMIIDGTVAK